MNQPVRGRMPRSLWVPLLVFLVGGGSAAGQPVIAQVRQFERTVTADGLRLDYPLDGVWRARARAVADTRARLRRQGGTELLNAAALEAVSGGAVVAGTLRFPTVLLDFAGVADRERPAAIFDSIVYTAQPLNGRPYSMRTFYEEMSNGLFTLDGRAYGWLLADSALTYYLDACGGENAIDCSAGRSRMRALFVSALSRLDADVNYAQYDNDGPDGVPNSGDDDGVVDLVQFVHSETGGECGGRGYWAHKSSLSSLGGRYRTGDQSAKGGSVFVNAYHVVSGVNAVSCADGRVMGIGVASHELGHGLGLPDLYATSGSSEGIGEWGLMGSAAYTSPTSPGHMEAWSKERLGWVTVREIQPGATYQLGPVVSGDTVFLVRPTGPNPRGEYFLLENKQPIGADTANLLTGRPDTGPKVGGLLVWHVDSAKIALDEFYNQVNVGLPKGVALVQADNARDLELGANRGDAGDPFPGAFGTTAFAGATAPASVRNAGGQFSGFGLHRVGPLQQGGAMGFYLAPEWIVRASGSPESFSISSVMVDGRAYDRFHDAPDSGTVHTVAVEMVQEDFWYRVEFVRWSDGGALTHDVTLGTAPDSLVAEMTRWYKVEIQVVGPGRGEVSPTIPTYPGVFHPAGTALKLKAIPDSGNSFVGWRNGLRAFPDPLPDTLTLMVHDAFALEATFAPTLVVAPAAPPVGTWGASFSYRFGASGGLSANHWWVVENGALPPGLTLSADGHLSGIPRQVGEFPVTISVISASQSVRFPLTIRVVAPVVDLSAAVAQIFSAGSVLPDASKDYLDFVGNENHVFDLGDVLALVRRLRSTPGGGTVPSSSSGAVQGGRP